MEFRLKSIILKKADNLANEGINLNKATAKTESIITNSFIVKPSLSFL